MTLAVDKSRVRRAVMAAFGECGTAPSTLAELMSIRDWSLQQTAQEILQKEREQVTIDDLYLIYPAILTPRAFVYFATVFLLQEEVTDVIGFTPTLVGLDTCSWGARRWLKTLWRHLDRRQRRALRIYFRAWARHDEYFYAKPFKKFKVMYGVSRSI